MKPAWDKLGDEYKSSKTVLIGDVDCTKEQDLCQKYGVQGYPTIKYFTGATSSQGDAYNGGRDYDTLSKWAKDNLGPACNRQEHRPLQRRAEEAHQGEAGSLRGGLDKEIADQEAELKKADDDLEELLKSLQSQYEAGKQKKDDTIAALSPKLALLRSVKRAKGDAKEL